MPEAGLGGGLACDLCVNNELACVNTELLRAYSDIDWRVRMGGCRLKMGSAVELACA